MGLLRCDSASIDAWSDSTQTGANRFKSTLVSLQQPRAIMIPKTISVRATRRARFHPELRFPVTSLTAAPCAAIILVARSRINACLPCVHLLFFWLCCAHVFLEVHRWENGAEVHTSISALGLLRLMHGRANIPASNLTGNVMI